MTPTAAICLLLGIVNVVTGALGIVSGTARPIYVINTMLGLVFLGLAAFFYQERFR